MVIEKKAHKKLMKYLKKANKILNECGELNKGGRPPKVKTTTITNHFGV